MCLYYPSDHYNSRKPFILAIYISFLLISVIPVFIDAINNARSPGEDKGRKWGIALFYGTHSIFINPVVTILGITAVFSQAHENLLQPLPQALSLVSLATQAMVLAGLAVSWIMRARFPYEKIDRITLNILITWYQAVGWAAVDNAIFAIGQAVLLWLVIHHAGRHADMAPSNETEPLLRGSGSVKGSMD